MKVTLSLNISEVQEEALEEWQWKPWLCRVTRESVCWASFHLPKVYAPRLTSVKADVTISWKLPAFQLHSCFCLPLAHALECVLDSLYLYFCEEASESIADCSQTPELGWSDINSVPLPVLALKFPPVLHWFSWFGFGEALKNHSRKAMAFINSVLSLTFLLRVPPERDSWLCASCPSLFFGHSRHMSSNLISFCLLTAPPVLGSVCMRMGKVVLG